MAAVSVITVDGPVSSGKGTVARAVASRLGWHLLDSGALYRLLGYHAEQLGVSLQDEAALQDLARALPVDFQDSQGDIRILLAGEDVTLAIRDEAVGELASRVAVMPAVREALLQRQQAFARSPGLVADGRDMGTVVFPDAPLKIFLTASAEERARRRYNQLKEKGFSANLAALIDDIRTRDERDTRRSVAPLEPAPDARVIDSTHMSVDEVVSSILEAASDHALI